MTGWTVPVVPGTDDVDLDPTDTAVGTVTETRSIATARSVIRADSATHP